MNRVFAVHTMGRCGSRTLAHSLFGQGYAAVHTHNFAEPIDPYEQTTKTILESYISFETDLWVLSTVRDPVARNLSVYFHTAVERSLEGFYEYPFNAPESWFLKEIMGYWGVDAFNIPFDKEHGWQVYNTKHIRARLVIIQLEKLEVKWPSIWSSITGGDRALDVPYLYRVGESHKPRYDQLSIGTDYLDAVYSNKVAETFYNEEDLERFRRNHEQR